ncbi:MFS transporter [Actinomadura rupiterrae]|uniref:MFS transporter n=1 Tax=Actinomadura rupiterrae TaxID=559627 RepID=UPI0020A4F3CE|nr:MFS transporter [Actinomadura rupiterrae]MCP2336544.1 EmrB/QacA subfamily drug resistance transporter [Actinomadura rupiterrae]
MSESSFLATRRGKLTLALLCGVAFLDFIDASIVNIALPAMRRALGFSVEGLQWVPSGYLLAYGGFMLLGGRVADLLGRRRVLVAGTVLFGAASAAGGLAQNAPVMVAARMVQGLGAAMMLPAALSLLTTSFREGPERNRALAVWGGMAGAASGAGVLLGGVLTDGLGWRWVMLVNLPVVAAVLVVVPMLLPDDRRTARLREFDIPGAFLVTGAMLLLVYTLVKAPDAGWGAARTIGGLAGAAVLLALFVLNEMRAAHPLLPLDTFRIRGLAAANVTQLLVLAGGAAMFFFLSLYMESILGYSPLQTGSAYLPLCACVGVAAGITSKLLPRLGTRPLIAVGALIGAAGLYLLSRVPVGGSYVSDLLPGLIVVALGLGVVFVSVTAAANAGVPANRAGIAAALLNSSQQLGTALGLAIMAVLAADRSSHLVKLGTDVQHATTEGFQRALFAGALFAVAAAVVGLGVRNTRGDEAPAEDARPELPEDVAADAGAEGFAGASRGGVADVR